MGITLIGAILSGMIAYSVLKRCREPRPGIFEKPYSEVLVFLCGFLCCFCCGFAFVSISFSHHVDRERVLKRDRHCDGLDGFVQRVQRPCGVF